MKTIYVKPDFQGGNGSAAAPFCALEDARNAAAQAVRAGETGGVEVVFSGGVYELTKTFELLKEHSGTADCPITYRAADGEKVFLTGGRTLPASHFVPVTDETILRRIPEEARAHVLQLDLKEEGITDYGTKRQTGFVQDVIPAPLELFIDNAAMDLARWPNGGRRLPLGEIVDPGADLSELRLDREDYHGPVIRYDYDRAERWLQAKDAFAFGYFGTGYADDNLPIASIDPQKKEIHFARPHYYQLDNHKYFNSYYVYNLLEEIDVPGEYYVDRENGVVYLYPPEGFTAASKVQVSMLEAPMVAMESAQHITLRGLTFENTRGMGIYSQDCAYTRIEDCVFRNLGMVAVSFGLGFEEIPQIVHNLTLTPAARKIGGIKTHMWDNQMFNRRAGHDNRVVSCEIYNTGTGGIILDGGDRTTLTPGNNEVLGCHLHDFARLDKTYRAGIRIFGMKNRIAFCRFANSVQMAIEPVGNDLLIEYNEFFNNCKDNYDNATIYSGAGAFTENSFGNVIRYNYFHGNGANKNEIVYGARVRSETYDVYLDGGNPGVSLNEVFGNVFYENDSMEGVFTNVNTVGNKICNNIFINQNAIYHARGDALCGKIEPYDFAKFFDDDAVIDKWDKAYPLAKEMRDPDAIRDGLHTICNNIHIGTGHFLRGTPEVHVMEGNAYFASDPGFVDMAHQNFRLKDDSVVFEKVPGFVNIPFAYIGNYKKYLEDHPEEA